MSGRLGAVGTLIWDRIWRPAGADTPVEQLGGAAYSLAALSAACPPGWSVAPIAKVGADLWDLASGWLARLPHLELWEGLHVVPEPNNRVELRYHDGANRCETLTGGVSPWTAAELLPCVADIDALYVNFISGLEMDLPTAQSLRSAFSGPIYADLHSLFLGPPGHGPRRPRPLPDWEAWFGCFDAVQMNEAELALLDVDANRIGDLLDLGPSLVVITRGAGGASYATAGGAGDLAPFSPRAAADGRPPTDASVGDVPTGRAPVAGDPTGCGDVWGATLFAELLGGGPLIDSIRRAHTAAASKIEHPSTAELHLALASSTTPQRVLP